MCTEETAVAIVARINARSHGGKLCGCSRAAQHQADSDELARVRELLSRWEGAEGWADVEADTQWDGGYKTCWRERAAELRVALTTTKTGE